MTLIQRNIAFFGGLLLGIAILSAYLLRDYGFAWNPFPGRNGASPRQEASASLGEGTAGGGIARGPSSLPTLPGSKMAGSQTGNGVVLLEEWLKLIVNNDGSNPVDLMQEMIQSLHGNPNGNAAFYQRARQVLEVGSIDAFKKQELIMALDRAATPAAIQLLAEWSQRELPANLKQSVMNAIAHVGDYYWEKQLLPEVVPILQQLWLQSEDPELLKAVAMAMANAGGAASINSLMETVLNNSKSLADIEHSNNPRVAAAWSSLQGLHNPDVVPALQRELQSGTSSLEVSVFAELLGGMGNIEATQALLSWAQGAADKYASIAHDAFAKTPTYDCLEYLNSALAQNPAFKSSLVKAAVLSALKK
jgi:hypothetical protein